jgi:alpha-beta hydrolase superfamily lysophospholipase
MMVGDLQSAYTFLIDRHNRGELNLSRLGVVALGEGANLVANWANIPGGAVSSQARTTDLGGIVLISPMVDAQSQGLRAQQAITALAPRVPLLMLAGERDTASAELVKAAKAAVVRPRTNKVELYPSSLHGFKLLRLEPNVTGTIVKFFDETIKAKAEEWEPRYNMDPVPFTDVQILPNTTRPDAAKAKAADELK